jgi:hypothetical protein
MNSANRAGFGCGSYDGSPPGKQVKGMGPVVFAVGGSSSVKSEVGVRDVEVCGARLCTMDSAVLGLEMLDYGARFRRKFTLNDAIHA